MKLTTIIMFLVKIRATFMFITFKIIEKQESYKIRGLKKKKNNSRVFLVFFKFKFSNIMLTRGFDSNTQKHSCPSGCQLARRSLCHVTTHQVLGSNLSWTLFFKLFIFSSYFFTNFNIFLINQNSSF